LKLRIQNNGEVDLNAFLLIGASTKEGDDTKIGFFGSGNKYAISCLIRNGIGFQVFSGQEQITFEKKVVVFNNNNFEQIWINGQSTSFTTRMGPTWEVWMALREFVCNAMDENGYIISCVEDSEVTGHDGKTNIFIDYIGEVADFYGKYDEFFLRKEPKHTSNTKSGKVDFISRSDDDNYIVYRKGVRCVPIKEQKSLFNYNFEKLEINESRIVDSSYTYLKLMTEAYAICTNSDIINKFLEVCLNDDYIESEMYWQYFEGSFSSEWKRELSGRTLIGENRAKFVNVSEIDNVKILPDKLVACLRKYVPDLSFYGKKDHDYNEVEVSQEVLDMVNMAEKEVLSYGIFTKLPIVIVDFHIKSRVGQLLDGTIYLSVNYLDNYDYLVSTIYEEYLHTLGYRDNDRQFEQYLMGRVVELMRVFKLYESIKDKMSKVEELVKIEQEFNTLKSVLKRFI
jgi:hypothetical protein